MSTKRNLLTLLTRESIVPLFRPFQWGAVTVFMLHRFADTAYGNTGHQVEILRANLGFLRRHHYRIIGLLDLVEELERDRLPSAPAVVFTVDDGYGDFARVAAPVFAEFDCPVTVFLTTSFVDGGFWMWNDKVSYAFAESKRPSLAIELEHARYEYSLHSTAARLCGADDLIEKLKRVPQSVAQSLIAELFRMSEVELPAEIPRRFMPMTWNDVSRCAGQGVTFGPHTISHPILSQVDDERAALEIQGSWQHLREQTSAAIPVFCYPNGDYASFSDRDRRTIASIGMRAAVIYDEHFATSRWAHANASPGTLELPRFPYPDDTAQFRQIVGGMERLKQTVRSVMHSSSRPSFSGVPR